MKTGCTKVVLAGNLPETTTHLKNSGSGGWN
jgi:hypothetical protein